jgi:hypothetical protein
VFYHDYKNTDHMGTRYRDSSIVCPVVDQPKFVLKVESHVLSTAARGS